jgi:hypothetical protein
MKTSIRLLIMIITMMIFTAEISIAQDDAVRPEFVTVTTMHWNMELENFDMDEWIATEKEFMDKVTKKNEHILQEGYYMHYFTSDNTELILVRTFANWEAIDQFADRNGELVAQAWPDEAERMAFMKKRNAYYAFKHADEIHATLPGAKLLPDNLDKNMVVYVRRSELKPLDGPWQERSELMRMDSEIFKKNDLIKGYYPLGHAWGSDNTQLVEAFYVESLASIDEMLQKNGELMESSMSDEKEREELGKTREKFFTGKHADQIFTMVHQLRK